MGIALIQYFSLNTDEAGPYIFCSNNSDLQALRISQEKQFRKFVWFGVDGMSYKFTGPIKAVLGNYSKFFMTQNDQLRYSFELLKTWFTGRDPDKPNIRLMKGDSIFESMIRGWGRRTVSFHGENWLFKSVFSNEYRERVFNQTDDVGETQILNDNIPFPWFFKNGQKKKAFSEELETLAKDGLSLFSYSAGTDILQHRDFRRDYPNFTASRKMVDYLAEGITIVRDFIDRHPDYLFVMSADHGHDDVGLMCCFLFY